MTKGVVSVRRIEGARGDLYRDGKLVASDVEIAPYITIEIDLSADVAMDDEQATEFAATTAHEEAEEREERARPKSNESLLEKLVRCASELTSPSRDSGNVPSVGAVLERAGIADGLLSPDLSVEALLLPRKVYLVWYTSPEQLEPDEPQLETIRSTKESAERAASGSSWYSIEERDLEP